MKTTYGEFCINSCSMYDFLIKFHQSAFGGVRPDIRGNSATLNKSHEDEDNALS